MRLQFVNWFPEWRGFYFFRWHKEKSDTAYIFDWFLGSAFWEIRKWHDLKDGELPKWEKSLAPKGEEEA